MRAEYTRHGTPIWVYRAPGVYHQMKEAVGSLAFWHEFAVASGGIRVDGAAAASAPLLQRSDPASVRWLVNEYIGSDEFADEFKPNTQKGIRNNLKRFADKHGDVAFRKVQAKNIKDLRDHIAKVGSDPEKPRPAKAQANQIVSAIRGMYKWAEDKGLLGDGVNPCAGVERKKHTVISRHKWTDIECDKIEAAYDYGTRARLLYELLTTGQRCCDIVNMGPQHIERRGDDWVMQVIQQKTGKPAWAPMMPNLKRAIDAARDAGVLGLTTFIGSEHDGTPISAGHFSTVMRRACDDIGIPECTAHGMRHYVAHHILDQGLGMEGLMSILGDTPERCSVYVREWQGKETAFKAAAKMGRKRKPDLKVVAAA